MNPGNYNIYIYHTPNDVHRYHTCGIISDNDIIYDIYTSMCLVR